MRAANTSGVQGTSRVPVLAMQWLPLDRIQSLRGRQVAQQLAHHSPSYPRHVVL